MYQPWPRQARLPSRLDPPSSKRLGFPYDNSMDSFALPSPAPTRGTASRTWLRVRQARQGGRPPRRPYFGRLWMWGLVQLLQQESWTVKDEDSLSRTLHETDQQPGAGRGQLLGSARPTRARPRPPGLSPNSRLLTSDSWGHLAYGSSECVTSAVGAYLVRLKLPAEGNGLRRGRAAPSPSRRRRRRKRRTKLRVHQLVRPAQLSNWRWGGDEQGVPTTRLRGMSPP